MQTWQAGHICLTSLKTLKTISSTALKTTNGCKVIRKCKDETRGIIVEEFVGLWPKMYSLLYSENNKTVEKKHITEQNFKHEHYELCLFPQEQEMALVEQRRSFQKNIFPIKFSKIGLSPFRNKRCISGNGRDTLSYGHHSLHHILDQHD